MTTQSQLDRFFPVLHHDTPSKCFLLDLPPSVRSQIYSSIELTKDGHIHLNIERFRNSCCMESRMVSTCRCVSCEVMNQETNNWLLFSSSSLLRLLSTCRTLYQEICPILYSSNHFTVSRTGSGGLSGLFRLRPLALASLTSLTIALNECKIYDADEPEIEIKFNDCFDCAGWEDVECGEFFEAASDVSIESPTITAVKPLGCVSPNDKLSLLEWNRLCQHIACSIPPNRLRLCLICDVEDVESAQEVIKPMRQLPILSACSIRFSTEADHNLRCMAVKAIQELTGGYSSLSPSPRLPQLPHEIQVQILKHSDLVAPHDLRWAPEQGFICLSQSPDEIDSVWVENPRALNPCEVCFGVHKPRHRLDCQPLKAACVSQCRCWRFPGELFLVSSAYHREATRIFYSLNHFYVYGGTSDSLDERDMCPRFIQQMPRIAGQYLRSLQFLLPRSARWSERDWKEDVLALSRSVELSRLTVTIDESLLRKDQHHFYGLITEGDTNDWWERAQDIVKPFIKLGGLKDFFVHLNYQTSSQDDEELCKKREKILERRVMGSDYDGKKRGKYLHRHRVYDA